MPLFGLTGKKAFVTGASRGIGRVIAAALAEAGADVALVAQIRSELRRLGCYAGGDADWATADMKRGIGKYAQYVRLSPPPEAPTASLLAELQSRRVRVCPLECSPRETEVGGRCVVKVFVYPERSRPRVYARPAPVPDTPQVGGPTMGDASWRTMRHY